MRVEVKYETNDNIYTIPLSRFLKLLGITKTTKEIETAVKREISRR